MKALINADVVTINEIISSGVILIEDGKIVDFGKASDIEVPKGCEIIDAGGCYAGPGFVDIHCHGGDKYLAQDGPAEAAAYHLKNGTTSLTLSLAYNVSYADTLRGIEAIRNAMKDGNPGNLNGIFFEGPFNNPSLGANSKAGRPVSREEYETLYEKAGSSIRQWMYAPEIENGDEFAKFVVSKGIPLAVGHTCASPEVIKKAVGFGASICTHLFDAMGCHLGAESIGVTGIIQDTAADAALVTDELYLEIICDSKAVHVKPSNLKLAYKCGGPDRVILITDGTTRDYDPSDYPETDVRNTKDINYNENGELSGSVLTMDRAFINMRRYTDAPIVDLFKMASSNPAKAIKIFDKTGSIEKNKAADIVLLDKDLDLKGVFLGGEPVAGV